MYKTVRGWLLDLLADLGGGLLYAVGIDTFARTADFAPGGISGLALIADHLWGLPVGLMSLVFNVPVVLLSFRLLGRRFLLRSLRSMLACTVFMDWVLPAAVTPYGGSPLLAALYSGACLGAGMALFYMRGSSSGGADFLIVSVKTLRPPSINWRGGPAFGPCGHFVGLASVRRRRRRAVRRALNRRQLDRD